MIAKAKTSARVAAVFQPQDFSARIAKHGDGQVQITVLVEIARLDVRHAAHVAEQDLLREFHALILQKHNSSDELIGREDIAKNGDHDVQVTILIQVDDRRMGRDLQVFAKSPFLPLSVGVLVVRQNAVPAGITGDNVKRAIIIQVDDRDIRDPHGIVIWAGQFLFLKIINKIGDVPFAAHVVGIQVEAITYLPAVAWGYAAATMTGQALGHRDADRAKRVGREAVLQCSLLALVISVAFFGGATNIYTFMHNDLAVREIGIPGLRLLALFQIPLAISIVYVHALRGAGDTRYPMMINVLGVLGIRLPVAYLLGVTFEGGLYGAWIGMCADVAVRVDTEDLLVEFLEPVIKRMPPIFFEEARVRQSGGHGPQKSYSLHTEP